jgi:hypothetical protein
MADEGSSSRLRPVRRSASLYHRMPSDFYEPVRPGTRNNRFHLVQFFVSTTPSLLVPPSPCRHHQPLPARCSQPHTPKVVPHAILCPLGISSPSRRPNVVASPIALSHLALSFLNHSSLEGCLLETRKLSVSIPIGNINLRSSLSVQDCLRVSRVTARLKVSSPVWQSLLSTSNAIHVDKAPQVTLDTLSESASRTRACAAALNKTNFFIPGEVTDGDSFGALYMYVVQLSIYNPLTLISLAVVVVPLPSFLPYQSGPIFPPSSVPHHLMLSTVWPSITQSEAMTNSIA